MYPLHNTLLALLVTLTIITTSAGYGVPPRTKRQLYRGDIPHHRPLDGTYEQRNAQNFLHDGGIQIDFDGNVRTHNINSENSMIKFHPEDAIHAPIPPSHHSHPEHPVLVHDNNHIHEHPTRVHDNQIHEHPVSFVEQSLAPAGVTTHHLHAQAHAQALAHAQQQEAPVVVAEVPRGGKLYKGPFTLLVSPNQAGAPAVPTKTQSFSTVVNHNHYQVVEG